jgi:hypothetical protein
MSFAVQIAGEIATWFCTKENPPTRRFVGGFGMEQGRLLTCPSRMMRRVSGQIQAVQNERIGNFDVPIVATSPP